YAKDDVVFKEGEPGQELFIVRFGKIGSFVKQADGTRRKIYDFEPGRFFGEMAIVEGQPRSATCWAEVDSELLVLDGIDFYRLVFEHPMIGLKILTAIGKTMATWLDESSRFLNDLVRWGETARRRAVEDALTGLFNRRFLEESLKGRFTAMTAGGRTFSLVMMDLDRFRDINALYGTAGGDKTIKAVADALRPALRDGDVASHLAGDEFAFLLPDTEIDSALATADRIRRSVESIDLEFFSITEGAARKVSLAASLGVASAPIHGDTADRLIASADRALFRAKEGGRNRVTLAEAD
ncbi:MAG: GGDEF domain-containing protein, partial [Treponemataceae bacterium]